WVRANHRRSQWRDVDRQLRRRHDGGKAQDRARERGRLASAAFERAWEAIVHAGEVAHGLRDLRRRRGGDSKLPVQTKRLGRALKQCLAQRREELRALSAGKRG